MSNNGSNSIIRQVHLYSLTNVNWMRRPERPLLLIDNLINTKNEKKNHNNRMVLDRLPYSNRISFLARFMCYGASKCDEISQAAEV